jgi:nucleoside-diphosphate-sugar epimerase
MTAGLRLAVTGASGFCGTAVARLAARSGASVVCLGRRPGPVGEHRPWDATLGAPDLSGVDAVVHLAAAVGDPPPGRAAEAAYRTVNVDGTARLLDAAGDRPVVWVSSASAYRPGRVDAPVREDHPCDGQRTAYGRTKAAGDRLARQAGAVVLRPRAVYGDGDRYLLPRLRRLVRGGHALLPGPDVPMSLTAVENLADACLAALGWPGGAYNIADGSAYSRDAVVAAVLGVPVRHVPLPVVRAVTVLAGLTRFAGRQPAVTRYAVDQLADGLVLDIGRALAMGWVPRCSLAAVLTTDRPDTPGGPGRGWGPPTHLG